MSESLKIRFNCPSCNRPLSVPVGMAGKQVGCPKCNQVLTVPPPEPIPEAIPVADDDTPEEEGEPLAFLSSPALSTHRPIPPRPLPHARSRGLVGTWKATSNTVKVLVVVGAVVLFLGIPILSAALGVSGHDGSNATCPLCGQRFHISEEYRGNLSEWLVKIPCPRCGGCSYAASYYDCSYRDKHPQEQPADAKFPYQEYKEGKVVGESTWNQLESK